MRRRAVAVAAVLAAALRCAGAAEPASAATLPEGAALFGERCGLCHAAGGTGTFMLERRLGKERALLAERTDLTAEYVRQVVRHGLQSMPRFTRVELTDAELSAVAAFLSSARKTPAR